ncbi:Methyltransferase-like protein 23 [Mactra antiquata]
MEQTTVVANRQFIFTDQSLDEKLEITIPEILDSSYGMFTWPCAPVLAQYLWYHRKWISDKTVFELGSGTALPGIVAAKCGANVHLSDTAKLSKCLQTSKKSCEANDVKDIKLHGLTWGQINETMIKLDIDKIDVIISSDCFYDTKDFDDIIFTVAFLIEKYKATEFVFTYQERSSSRCIEHLLDRWNFTGVQVPLSTFDADKASIAGSGLPGNHTVHLFKVTTS